MISPDELIRLWSEHAAALELLARARCSSPDDCVQVAFIRLASCEDVPDDPVAWLARVVRNLAIDHSRTELRRQRREREFAAAYREAFEGTASLDDTLDAEEVAQALLELDVDTRELVTAHVWTGLSFRQIGAAFGISSSSAHRQYLAALDQLRQALRAGERLS